MTDGRNLDEGEVVWRELGDTRAKADRFPPVLPSSARPGLLSTPTRKICAQFEVYRV